MYNRGACSQSGTHLQFNGYWNFNEVEIKFQLNFDQATTNSPMTYVLVSSAKVMRNEQLKMSSYVRL